MNNDALAVEAVRADRKVTNAKSKRLRFSLPVDITLVERDDINDLKIERTQALIYDHTGPVALLDFTAAFKQLYDQWDLPIGGFKQQIEERGSALDIDIEGDISE